MARSRSVSPVGASRFEQPYDPPNRSSKPTSPTSPSSTDDTSWSQASRADTMRTATTATTADTFIDTALRGKDADFGPARPVSPGDSTAPSGSLPPADADEWFARFRSEPDLAVAVGDDCPDRATLAAVYDVPIYDASGAARPFGSIYDPTYALHARQLVLFVRHFYCGACQAYLRALSASITRDDYFAIPTPTSIVIIGCGQPDLIRHYKTFTDCPFPIYADPSRALFKKLGMVVSVNLGSERPEYMRDISVPAWLGGQVTTIHRSLKDPDGIRKRDVFRGGNPMQIGGEFFFDNGEVVWCHRMKNYRDHVDIRRIRELLELDD